MKFFSSFSRPKQNATQIPHVRVGVAHLLGPGKLRCEAEHLVYETDGTKQIRLDVEGLESVLAFGKVSLTADAIELLHRKRIAFTILSPNGGYVWGRLAQESSDRALGRLLQFQAYEDPLWQLYSARRQVRLKVDSTHVALRHYQRQGKKISPTVLKRVEAALESVTKASTVDQLRGIEGHVAAAWFGEYDKLFGRTWKFENRNRRPPRDPINSLLSLGYMQLYRRCVARLEAAGFEPSLGALHEFRAGRMSLACDLMEPLRIPVVDRWVVGICQQGIVKPDAFTSSAADGVRLKEEQLVKVLGRFEEWWHQGLFGVILDESVNQFRISLREHISEGASRASRYLKEQAIRACKGSGGAEVYDP